VNSPLRRHPANPVLTARQCDFPATLVFNAGVVKFQGRYVCVFRNDFGREEDTTFDGTNLGIAYSDDGLAWDVADQPCIDVQKARRLVASFYDPATDLDREIRRFYDPRLTVIDGRVVMCFAVDTMHGLRGGMATTDDFEQWEVLHLSAPDNRNMVLFPETIDGDYVRLERPFNDYGGPSMNAGKFHVWSSRSTDLRRWGDTRLLLGAEQVPWANNKIGPAAPPIRTERGWLCTFHGVDLDPQRGKNGWEPTWQKVYHAGLMLLDIDDPTRVIAMAEQPLLSPEADYERQGFRGDVIFPGGMLLEDDGEVKIYYGAADTVQALATAHLDDLLSYCCAD
jgi:beta-1,4-mannooligosaccharide/beta-1,4-mannosyl-N-acetylglucosamine phosphorylase